MKWLGKATLALLVAGCTLFSACATSNIAQPSAAAGPQTGAQTSAFGGIPPVTLPPDAAAMSDFLKAEVASDEGDRKNAMLFYEAAAQADPPFPKLGAGKLIIRSVSQKQRPRR